ncbi:MAG TPA: peptidylprolyl isomerase [Gemmatimonadaceae bacterium]|nr:peptidylprolyl isomerase [Gemmatimonadaceae bacterium]
MPSSFRFRPVLLAGAVGLATACARAPRSQPLLAPTPDALAAPAPDSFLVTFETTRGPVDVLVRRHWSPAGADRLYYLVRHGFYDGARFFRVVPGFVVQFGIPADPAVAEAWRERRIPDDTVRASNRRGMVSFARGGPATRTTQLFINLRDNPRLDTLNGFGFPPVGEVVNGGMAVVDSLYGGYGEGAPRGRGPSQDSIRALGEPYLAAHFPELDAIRRTRVVREWRR